jgi:aspartyl-tRNA(Asn)/glutamyl-tRNA(Gln) amidotransferase subunit B
MKEIKGMIGLEIHTYLVTNEKLFCKCKVSREKGLKMNINICPICTGQPGAKPLAPNKIAVEKAVQIGLMLNCTINKRLVWQRKHYNWPDMPKGYQNTISGTHAIPLGVKGEFHGIRISSMHLEEDPASWNPDTGEVDYNRSGLPLVEIITEPDFETSEQVALWLNKLIHNMSYLKCVDSNAGIKVDVNVNIPKVSKRAEIKNINSIENIQKAIDYEFQRHLKEKPQVQETRRYDALKNKTMLMRSKEDAEDYRFISDPDLINIYLTDEFIESEKSKIPESPDIKLQKLIKKHNIDKKNAEVLTKNVDIADFYEKVIENIDAKFALPWVTINLLRLMNDNKTSLDKCDIKVEHFVSLISKVKNNQITELQAKKILKEFYPKSYDLNKKDIKGKITDEKEIEVYAKQAIQQNPKAVTDFRAGEQNAFNFLLGAIMRLSEKRADFNVARNVLQRMLK